MSVFVIYLSCSVLTFVKESQRETAQKGAGESVHVTGCLHQLPATVARSPSLGTQHPWPLLSVFGLLHDLHFACHRPSGSALEPVLTFSSPEEQSRSTGLCLADRINQFILWAGGDFSPRTPM